MSYPSTVKAVTIAKTGDIDVIEVTSQPFPEVPRGHIVVKVEYGGINLIDTYFRKGSYPLQKLPAILGSEIAGTIVGLPQDPSVLSQEEYKKRGYKIGTKVACYSSGSHAEYASVAWEYAVPLPDGVSAKLGAAALAQGLTAITFMDETYDVQKGDIVLVHTVAGGLGLIFAQYAKWKGATVIGTTSTSEKAELAKANGADHVILYRDEDVVKRVLEITNGEGVHAIFDGVGKDTFEADFDMIRRKGTLVAVGNASGAVPPFAPLKLAGKNIKLARPTLRNYIYTPEEISYYSDKLFGLIRDGILKIKIWHEYPLTAEGVQQAQRDLTGGKTMGKLIVKISD